MNKLNKKADSRLLSPWLFFVFAIIGVSIVIGVWIFYAIETDIRFAEARTLSNRLISTISENGYLKEGVLGESFDILEKAELTNKSFVRGGNFYFNVIVYDGGVVDGGVVGEEVVLRNFWGGETDFETQCRLIGKPLAKCVYDEFIVLNKTDPNQYFKIKILAGSNQLGKKI